MSEWQWLVALEAGLFFWVVCWETTATWGGGDGGDVDLPCGADVLCVAVCGAGVGDGVVGVWVLGVVVGESRARVGMCWVGLRLGVR